MKNRIILDYTDYHAIRTCKNVIKKLLMFSEEYKTSSSKFNTLVKAYNSLESFPYGKVRGYIDISANTHILGGALDYSSFTIGEDYLEIYTGFIKYDNGECDDSIWEKVYSSKDNTKKATLIAALNCWAESFLLHLEDNTQGALCVIDKSNIEGDTDILCESKPKPVIGTPEYSYESIPEFDEVSY